MLYGKGINDADYKITEVEYLGNSKTRNLWMCPYYGRWAGLLERCLSNNFKDKHPTYRECSVCDEWLTFSNFKSWMEQQDWEGKELDKDLLVFGNKIYSPTTCCFVTKEVNSLLLTSSGSRGNLPLGVKLASTPRTKPYLVQLSMRKYKGIRNFVGYFLTPEEGHRAWQLAKCNVILHVADSYPEDSIEYTVLLRARDRIYEDYSNNKETL